MESLLQARQFELQNAQKQIEQNETNITKLKDKLSKL